MVGFGVSLQINPGAAHLCGFSSPAVTQLSLHRHAAESAFYSAPVEQNSCTNGGAAVKTEAKCRIASESLGFSFKGAAEVDDWMNKPFCYLDEQRQGSFFNQNLAKFGIFSSGGKVDPASINQTKRVCETSTFTASCHPELRAARLFFCQRNDLKTAP